MADGGRRLGGLMRAPWWTEQCALTDLYVRFGVMCVRSIAAGLFSLRSRSSREGSSFLCPNKETKQRNSPSALFCLLRHFSPLNKKNSLRSNSFLFFTLRKAPPLHGKKVRPDLDLFFDSTSLRSLLVYVFFLRSLPVGVCSMWAVLASPSLSSRA